MRRDALGFLAALLTPTCLTADAPAAPPGPDATFVADTRAYLGRLERLGFAGVVLIASDGEPLIADGYGLADRQRGTSWSPATVSTIGSITKQFTGAAILLLEEDGRLAVEDPITKHFPGVPEEKRSITLHHLLTHSSGIVDLDGLGDWDPISRDEFIRQALDQDVAFAPGAGYAYSNAGYSLLGAIIEQVAGSSYEQFVRERLFVPNGMYETGYVLAPWGEDRVAQGYAGGQCWGTVLQRPMDTDGPYWVLRANGGIHSTAFDMLRWSRALTAGRVLSPSSMKRYWAPHVSEGGDTHYGYGWVTRTLPNGMQVITHDGGNGILFADAAIVVDAGAFIFLQTNVVADFPLADNLLQQIGRRLLAGSPYPSVPDVVERAPEATARLAGEYRVLDPDPDLVLDPDGTLVVAVDGERRMSIEARGRRTFARLHSTRPADDDRCDRLSTRIDRVVSAWLGGDFEPLHEAYGGRISLERIRTSRQRALREWESEHGPLKRHEILGTALRQERDATVVRFLFERGHEDRCYVWEPDAEEHLLGYSRRGIDTRVPIHPVEGDGFAAWDRMTGASKPLRFAPGDDGRMTLTLGEGRQAVRGRR